MEIIFATHNAHKLQEVQALLPSSIQLISLQDLGFFDEIEETGSTIEANSQLKAKTIYERFKKPVLAEDTGLEIVALGGEPGVYSARYAGEPSNALENMKKVLEKMEGIQDRRAQFKTLATFIYENTYYSFEGIVLGNITLTPKGTDGFGYDPIFQPAGFDKVFAEMLSTEKNIISHRAIAIKKFINFVKKL
jgi:XTP/dITP diphosphohydrolase